MSAAAGCPPATAACFSDDSECVVHEPPVMNPLNSPWVAVMEVGFVGYLASLALLVWRGVAASGRVNRRPLVGYGCLAVVFFVLWLVGLHQA